MDWIEVCVTTTSEGTETVFGVLLSCGINGAQIIDDQEMQRFLSEHPYTWDYIDEELAAASDKNAYVLFYISPDPVGREMLAQVKDQLRVLHQADIGIPLGTLSVSETSVNDASWLNEWKKYYKPFRIGRTVVVKPLWEVYTAAPEDVVFTIDPGSVFGTGLHPSTQLCIEALETYSAPGQTILDVGCGSGILSVIAMLMGADFTLACDIEPAAAVNAVENARLNGINLSQYIALTGDIFTLESLIDEINKRKYDVVFANIVADVVIGLAPAVRGYLSPGGVLISSGVITERLEEVREALYRAGLTVVSILERDGWNCVVCQSIL